MSRRTDADVIAKIDALYARLPTVPCQGRCAGSCGPIPLSVVEADRLRRATHQRLRTVGPAGASCAYLSASGRCTVYALRPAICRLYGALKRLCCPFGCVPERWVSDHEALALLQAVEAIGGGTVMTGPAGVVALDRPLADLDADRASAARVDAEADFVYGIRVLHGGRVLGAHAGPALNLDDRDALNAEDARLRAENTQRAIDDSREQ
jgi:hypothetical protein